MREEESSRGVRMDHYINCYRCDDSMRVNDGAIRSDVRGGNGNSNTTTI